MMEWSKPGKLRKNTQKRGKIPGHVSGKLDFTSGRNLSEHYKNSQNIKHFNIPNPLSSICLRYSEKKTSGGAMVIYNNAKFKKHLKQIQAYVETNPN